MPTSATAKRQRIALVGPTHPYKGGIAQHTTVLAQRLAAAGHDVRIVSWLRQYPTRLYPGRQTVKVAEFVTFPQTERTLSWNRPDTWVRAARRLRTDDLVVFAHVTPAQAVPYRVMLGSLHGHVRTAVICHNVLPHESSKVDEPLVRALLGAMDRVLVHSTAQRDEARRLTRAPVVVAPLPPFAPPAFAGQPTPGEHRRLLFFGLVRPYKGLDVLLRALAAGPDDVRLRVAGEFWGGTASTESLARALGIADRVELRPGYVAADEVPALFADVDALVLPYRAATGSQGVWTGFQFGLPVIATSAGQLAAGIDDGVDGLVVPPDDAGALAAALETFYAPGVATTMRSAVAAQDPAPQWERYLAALLAPCAADGTGR